MVAAKFFVAAMLLVVVGYSMATSPSIVKGEFLLRDFMDKVGKKTVHFLDSFKEVADGGNIDDEIESYCKEYKESRYAVVKRLWDACSKASDADFAAMQRTIESPEWGAPGPHDAIVKVCQAAKKLA